MIDDLDRSLEALLRSTLPQGLVAQAGISFATPDDQFPPTAVTLPAIDLFLYDVRENRELRSNEWVSERRSNGMARSSPPLVRVDCSYLISAWPRKTSPQPPLDEHHLLGQVMAALLRFPTLPATVLKGALANQELPPPTAILHPGRLQSVGEFWQALGGKPKAVINYTVTIAVQPGEPVEAPLVRENIVRAPSADGDPTKPNGGNP